MMNLFSPFNPITSSTMSMNWLMMAITILTTFTPYWYNNSMITLMNKKLMMNMNKQIKSSMNKSNLNSMMMMITLMMIIMNMNITSLLPYTFAPSSHIMMNMSMAMIMWTSLTMNKLNNMNKFMSSMTPSNTPTPLIPFMVMIELTSMMIQPITLSIRLTANVTAGHIMMIMISQMYSNSVLTALTLNLSMMIMELGMSIIQAYVFTMLITMYNK